MTTPIMTTPPVPAVPAADGAGGRVLAGRGTRLSAAGIDGAIFMLAFLPALVDITQAIVRRYLEEETLGWSFTWSAGVAVTGLLLLALGVATTILVARGGQTVGKKLLGIRVVRSDGSPAGLGRIFWLRNVAASVPSLLQFGGSALTAVGLLYSLVDDLLIFGDTRQCLHDRIADTIVVRA